VSTNEDEEVCPRNTWFPYATARMSKLVKGKRLQRGAYAVTSVYRLTSLRADPEIGRTGIHQNLEITRGSAHLDGRKIAHIIALDVKRE
jgi:hypothetical protein